MRLYLNILFFIGALLSLCSCTKKDPNIITIAEMLHKYGDPAVIASGFEINHYTQLSSITLYGVNQRVSSETINQLKPGQLVVFSSEQRFIREVGIHFENMHDPTVYSGSTMYASLFTNGTDLKIFRIVENGNAELQYLDNVSVVYLEVGDKGHLVKVIPQIGSAPPATSSVPLPAP